MLKIEFFRYSIRILILVFLGAVLIPFQTLSADIFNPDEYLNNPKIKKELLKISSDSAAVNVFKKTAKEFGLGKDVLSFFNGVTGGVYDQQINLILKMPISQWKETFANGWSPYKTQYVQEIIKGNPVKLTSKIGEIGGNVVTFLSALSIASDIADGLNGNDSAKLSAIAGTEGMVRGYLISKYGTSGLGLAMIPVGAISYALNNFINTRYNQYSDFWWDAYSSYLSKKYPRIIPQKDENGTIIKEEVTWVGLTTHKGSEGLNKRMYEFWDDAQVNAEEYYKKPKIWNKSSALAFSSYGDEFAARYFKEYIHTTLKTYYGKEAEKAKLWSRYQAEIELKELDKLIDVLRGLQAAILYADKVSEFDSITIIPAQKTLKVGESITFTIITKNKTGEESDVTAKALPSNTFTATNPGTYYIMANFEGKSKVATITVEELLATAAMDSSLEDEGATSDEPPLPTTEELPPEGKDPLAELRTLRDRAIQLSSAVCADAATATASMEAIGVTAESAQPSFSKFEKSIQEAVKAARDIESIERILAESHQTVEGLAVQIGDDTALAGARREIVCQTANAMKTCNTNSERDRLYAEAMAAHVDVKPAFERARANSLDLEGLNGVVKEKLEKLTKAQQVTNSISGLPEDLITAKSDVSQNIASAEALLLAATETKLPAIKLINDTAEDLATQLKTKSEEKPDNEPLLNEINVIMGQISAQTENANGCLEEPKNKLEAEKGKADLFLNRYSKLEINFNRIKKTFSVDDEGNPNSFFASALEKANLADLLISMGGGYIRTCAEHLVMAKACMNAADQLSTVDFSILMPSVVGMTCQDGANAVATNKIGYQIVSSGLAPHPDWEYCVEATEPAGDAEVSLSEGSTALIGCFEELDIPFYLATVDCSWLPGGTAVYDHGQRNGVCDCINGMVFNPSKTRCINCEEYFESMVSAFNAGDLDTAQAWVNEARWCPWSAEAQGQIDAERHRRLCANIIGNIEGACQAKDAHAANGLLSEAFSQECQVDPELGQRVIALVEAYNQQVREKNAERTRQSNKNMQNVVDIITQGIKGYNQATRGGSTGTDGFGIGHSTETYQSGGSSESSSSSSNNCKPGTICIFGETVGPATHGN